MTEEKENCNFQQNYNVFGLDDKPCCYLYHKYCGEIDSCYFKRCKRLEQENKELKEMLSKEPKAMQAFQIAYSSNKKENEVLWGMIKDYKSALEEIRIMATKDVSIESFVKIQNRINEVLSEN